MDVEKLTNEQLWWRWKKTGDDQVRNYLVSRNSGLIYKAVFRNAKIIGPENYRLADDVVQECFLALTRRWINNYKPGKRIKFSTYIVACANLYCRKIFYHGFHNIHVPVNSRFPIDAERARSAISLDYAIPKNEDEFVKALFDPESNKLPDFLMSEKLQRAIQQLPPRLCIVIKAWMWGKTLREIGQIIGVTRERVRQLKGRALIILRELLNVDANGSASKPQCTKLGIYARRAWKEDCAFFTDPQKVHSA
jgi:RNA polymerase sigma factor (sigma-70 family)